MNISLGGAGASKKKKKFGLNKRGGAKSNVFGGDSSSSEDEGNQPMSSKAAVNQALEKEQQALRKRAQAAMESSAYDFDGSYDDVQNAGKKEKDGDSGPSEKKSRYISDLLKASEKRNQEREIIMERKIAREQDAEDQQADFRDKDKFVTSAYRQKLAERKAWLEDDRKKEKEEEENDVTKRSGGMANFYGNFSRNVAVGGAEAASEQETSKPKARTSELGFLDGFEQSASSKKADENDESHEGKLLASTEEPSSSTGESKPSMRQIREKKVADARIRYFKRQGITT